MNWGEALRTVLGTYAASKYCWGSFDCVKFVNAYALEMTGVDHAARFNYDSEASALKLMSLHGGVEGLIQSCLGEPKPDATAGDIVVCHIENSIIPGVTNGSLVWAFIDERGLSRIPNKFITAAWSV